MGIRNHRAVIVVILGALLANASAQNTADAQSRCAVAGTVVDAVSGQPVRAAEVSATSLSVGGGAEPNPAYTDANGRFAIDNLEPGRYVLQASHDSYTSPDHPSGPGFGIVVLAPGQQVEDAVISLMPGGIIAGHVTNETKSPLSGVYLQAMKSSYRDGKRELEEVASASTNRRGEYRMAGLLPGRYYLRATSSHPAPIAGKDKAYVPLYYPAASDLARAEELAVRAGEELAGIDMSFAPFPTVHIKGRVIDTRSSSPPKGVEITLLSDEGHTFFSPGQTLTDADGGFDFPGIPKGSYVLVARLDIDTAPETTLWGKKSLVVSDANVEDVKILLGPGVNVGGRIRIEGKASLDVSTLKATLEPQEGVTVNSLMPAVENASITSDGIFTFHHVPEGTYNISFFPLPVGFYLGEKEGLEVLETGVIVGPGHAAPSLELILSPASATIDGMVSGDGTLAGASIVLVPDGSRRSQPRNYRMSVSNRLGKFTFRGVEPGDYKLFACEEITSGAFMDPDFLRQYEDSGLAVHLEQNAHLSVQVPMLSRSTSQ
jgi:5-hydroxyisourate hydrolase-like protein (transthyretin family)